MKKRLIVITLLALVFSMIFTSCDLLSGDKEVSKLTIVDGTFKYEYKVGETVDLANIKVQADYNDGSSKVLSYSDLEISQIDTSTVGTKKVTIAYSGVTITVDVKVVQALEEEQKATLSSIAIDTSSVAVRVIKGSSYSTEGIKVIATYSDNTTKTIPASELTVGTVDTTSAGAKTLTVTYGEKTAELTVNVVEVTALQVIGEGSLGITVMQGATISTSVFTAFATYSDGVVEAVANDALTFTVPSTEEAGSKTLTVAYRGFETTVPVTVKAPAGVIGIEVDYNSIKDYTTVADGVALNMDAIKENIVVVAVFGYVNGTATEIEKKETITDKTSLSITETNEETRFITVTYGEYSVYITISETAATVTGIEVIGYATGVKIGKTYDNSKIKINVTYSNGATEEVAYGAAGLTASQVSTENAGAVNLDVSYGGFTKTVTVTVYGVSSVTPVGTVNPVVIGGTLYYADLQFAVMYEDNTAETVPVSDVTVGEISTAEAGDKTFTVTYYGVNGTVPYTVLGVKSVAINAGTLTTTYKVGDTFSYAGITITVTYTDDSTATFNVTEATDAGVVFNTDAINNAAVGEYNFTVSYKGVTSAAVVIKYKAVDYEIIAVSAPGSITTLGTNKKYYLNGSYGYLVGDDNPFKYSLTLSAYNFNGEKVSITKYTSKSLVYLVEGETILNTTQTLLEGAELAKYVTVDEANNSFDFTDEAIGKKFMIATRPAYGITVETEAEYAEYTRTHTFEVVDGYNVYNAKELHVMTNTDDIHDDATKLEWTRSFLANAGIFVPEYEIRSVVLHNDINITKNDIPAQYFETTGELIDYASIYIRDIAKGDFTIHGNYFTINSYNIPSIKDNENNNKNSHSQLFRFENSAASTTFDYKEYDLRIENLYILDNDPNAPLDSGSVRSRLGLIGIKIGHCETVLDNIVAERYYITIMQEYDNSELNINESKLYNAWQNHIFLWSKNVLVDTDENPSANFSPLKCNVTKSQITVCGGPVIISQTASPEQKRQVNSGADIYIDSESSVNTYVTADSIWFTAMGASPYATQIIALDNVIKYYAGGTFVTNKAPDGSEGEFLDLVAVTLPGGETMTEILGAADIDGTLTVNGKLVSSMDDDAMLLENLVKSAIKEQIKDVIKAQYPGIDDATADAQATALLKDIPVLKSSNGGWAYIMQDGENEPYYLVDLSSSINALGAAYGISVPAFAPEANGGYITMYYMGMAIVIDNFRPLA